MRYQKLYEAVKDELVNSFFGPAETGTYSPSVQNTLYLMAKAVLLRYWFLKNLVVFMSSKLLMSPCAFFWM